MLLVSLLSMTAGYTLMYAGMRPGTNDRYAHAPWLLWVDAFKQLNIEIAHPGVAEQGTPAQTSKGAFASGSSSSSGGGLPSLTQVGESIVSNIAGFFGG
jgi:hypothetical protein